MKKKKIEEWIEKECPTSNVDIAPIPTILDNAKRFVQNLITQGLQLPNEDSMYATPYGTIVIDIQNERGIVSIEIGNEKLGFFY